MNSNSPPATTPGAAAAPPPARSTIVTDASEFLDLAGPCGRLLGLDVGTKTIGLALSDVLRMVATGTDTIRRTKFRDDARQLLDLATSQQVAGFVIGLPLDMIGTSGPRVQATRAFARNLAALTRLPMLLWDERLTTAAAERMLIEADQSRKRRAEVIDKVAATLILQGALDRLRTAGPATTADAP